MTEEVTQYQEPSEDVLELERKIELLTQARINLRVSPVIFDRLMRQAEFNRVTIEEHCTKIIEDSLNTLVGKATIGSPSAFGDSPTVGRKITAPMNTVTRA